MCFSCKKKCAFLGATPDGKMSNNGECGITEVKCPFRPRHMNIVQACDEVRDFCLENNSGVIQLKKSHDYYAQMQGQLMSTGFSFCEFILFTQCDIHQERIRPDVLFMREMLEKL